jgi:two-component system chemotaxis sensor kinase CheA
MYIFEETQLLEQLEQIIIQIEQSNCYDCDCINEIFRIMHTIKGSSAMMQFNCISDLSHSVEDLFFFIREKKPVKIDFPKLSDIVLESVDFIKKELKKIKAGKDPDKDAFSLIDTIKSYLIKLKEINKKNDADSACAQRSFKAVIYFENGCEMENIRAYAVIHNLNDIAQDIHYLPENIDDAENGIDAI